MRQAITTSFLCLLLVVAVSSVTPRNLHSQSVSQIVPQECNTKPDGCGWTDLLKLVNNFIKFLFYASAAIATVSFSYAGFLYLTSGGKPAQAEKAKEIFLKVLIGFIVIFTAFLLVQFILKGLGIKDNYSLL